MRTPSGWSVWGTFVRVEIETTTNIRYIAVIVKVSSVSNSPFGEHVSHVKCDCLLVCLYPIAIMAKIW